MPSLADQMSTIWYVNGEVVCDYVVPNNYGETSCEMSLGVEDTQITLAVRDTNTRAGYLLW